MSKHFRTTAMDSSGGTRSLVSFNTVRWLLTFSCVTCAVINSNEAVHSNGDPYLVFTSGALITSINLNGSNSTTVLNRTSEIRPNGVGIDFDYEHEYLFWVDTTQLQIMRSKLDGSEVTTIVSTGLVTPDRVAYDWITQKIYWSDYGDSEIEIIDLRTNYRRVLISTGEDGVSRPRAIVLDPSTRYMYWTDWAEEAAAIERASMDGQNRRVILDTQISLPSGLTLDHTTQRLYFIDGYYDRLESISTDGSDRQLLKSFSYNVVPFSLVYHDGALYWTDRLMKMIARLSIEDRVMSNLTSTEMRPAGLALVAAERQPSFPNHCEGSPCSHLCLLSAVDSRSFTCTCEDGIELDEDGVTCLVPTPTPTPEPSSSFSPTPTLEIKTTSCPSPTPSSSPSDICEALRPCKNNGVCKSTSAFEYMCVCPPNYTGPQCEDSVRPSACELAKPCQNGATCVDIGILEYQCICTPGYEGRYCQVLTNFGVCNTSNPCFNGGVCTNLKEEEGGYWCACPEGYNGINCSILPIKEPSIISPPVFVGVIGGLLLIVGILVLTIVCVFAMLKKQKEKNKALESGTCSRSDSPIIKKRNPAQGDDTPSSSDTASHDYWSIKSGSPSLNRLHVSTIHGNIYSQSPKRGAAPNLGKFAKDKRYDDVPPESKLVTI